MMEEFVLFSENEQLGGEAPCKVGAKAGIQHRRIG